MVRATPNDRISHNYLNYIISPRGSGVADRFFKTVSEDLVSGMEWLKLTEAPSNGQEVKHTELAEALEGGKLNFTQSEWKKFGVSNLTPNHFVKAGDKYFKPANLGYKLKHTGSKIPSIDIQQIQELPEYERQQWEKVYSDYIDRENLATLQAAEEWDSISENDAQSGRELEDLRDLYKKKVATGIIRSLVGSLTKKSEGDAENPVDPSPLFNTIFTYVQQNPPGNVWYTFKMAIEEFREELGQDVTFEEAATLFFFRGTQDTFPTFRGSKRKKKKSARGQTRKRHMHGYPHNQRGVEKSLRRRRSSRRRLSKTGTKRSHRKSGRSKGYLKHA